MLIKDMKDYLIGKWPGSRWADKVRAMPDDQVIAVYQRKIKTAPQRPVVHGHNLPNQVSVYTCTACYRSFTADNPELTECRFCGGQVIMETEVVSIKKGNQHEN